MGYTAAGYEDNPDLPTFHFPDGNATIARLLVRDLIPNAIPGHGAKTSSPLARITRSSTAQVRRSPSACPARWSARAISATPKTSRGVEVAYPRGGELYRVHAANCMLAGWNMMIPYICPELPDAQKAALHQLVKIPLVYTSVAIRNWRAFHKLGVAGISSPGMYWTATRLNWPVDVGAYKSVRSPDDPILLFMLRAPVSPGLPERDQHRAGRYELLRPVLRTSSRRSATSFSACLDRPALAPRRYHGHHRKSLAARICL